MINKDKKTATELPKEVFEYLNNNLMFNKFGIVNIRVVIASTNCEIKERKLKSLITARFKKEMVTGKIEFINKNSNGRTKNNDNKKG